MKTKITISRNSAIAIVLISAVVILLFLNLLYADKQGNNAEDKDVSYFKGMAEEAHKQFLEMLAEASNIKPQTITQDMNFAQRQRILMLNALQESVKADMNWLAEKENAIYLQSKDAKEKTETTNIANKETALLVFSMQMIMLNNGTIKTALPLYEDSNSVIAEAEALKNEIIVGYFSLGDEFAEMLQGTSINSEFVEEQVAEFMQDYADLREKEFEDSLQQEDDKRLFVEAVKLLSLKYFLESSEGE